MKVMNPYIELSKNNAWEIIISSSTSLRKVKLEE